MSKLVLNVKYLLMLSILTSTEFYNIGALIQKISFVICLYYFQFRFSFLLKKSKQTFNVKFVIGRPVKMTWSARYKWMCKLKLKSLMALNCLMVKVRIFERIFLSNKWINKTLQTTSLLLKLRIVPSIWM